MKKSYIFGLMAMLFMALLAANLVNASDDKKHKIVIQVSTDDVKTQAIAMNNAVNLQKHYGMDEIDIEIVAFGPGVGMLTAKNDQSSRVQSLLAQDISFSACGNTLNKIEQKKGKKPALTEGVVVVPAGAAQIMELQEKGYAYLRP